MRDLIDRHEAIDIVRNIIVKEVTPAYMLIDKAEVMTELMMMPPAEPELAQDFHNACIDAISRQAAIELIENESRKWGDEYGVSDVLCDLADLPSAHPEERTQERTETHACDLISRQAALECLEWRYPDALPATKIKELPSVKPERPKGEWITDDLSGIISCNRCGNHAPMETTGGGQYKSKFCPDCGADMRGKRDDEQASTIDVEEALNMAISALAEQPETHDKRTKMHGVCLDAISRQSTVGQVFDEDTISRQAAISLPVKPKEDRFFQTQNLDDAYDYGWRDLQGCIEKMPSVQPEIIDWQAVEHLQETGWMQNHDKQMYEMGLRERLADDSDSYDAILPSAQPEQSIAQERYEDLCEYFKDCSDQGRSTLNDKKEFKSWLDRMKWHVMECDKLGRELEKIKSAQPQYEELTPEEAASEITSGSILRDSYWLDIMIALKQMGYAICRKKG